MNSKKILDVMDEEISYEDSYDFEEERSLKKELLLTQKKDIEENMKFRERQLNINKFLVILPMITIFINLLLSFKSEFMEITIFLSLLLSFIFLGICYKINLINKKENFYYGVLIGILYFLFIVFIISKGTIIQKQNFPIPLEKQSQEDVLYCKNSDCYNSTIQKFKVDKYQIIKDKYFLILEKEFFEKYNDIEISLINKNEKNFRNFNLNELEKDKFDLDNKIILEITRDEFKELEKIKIIYKVERFERKKLNGFLKTKFINISNSEILFEIEKNIDKKIIFKKYSELDYIIKKDNKIIYFEKFEPLASNCDMRMKNYENENHFLEVDDDKYDGIEIDGFLTKNFINFSNKIDMVCS